MSQGVVQVGVVCDFPGREAGSLEPSGVILGGSGCVGENKFGSRWRGGQRMPCDVLSIRGASEDHGV